MVFSGNCHYVKQSLDFDLFETGDYFAVFMVVIA